MKYIPLTNDGLPDCDNLIAWSLTAWICNTSYNNILYLLDWQFLVEFAMLSGRQLPHLSSQNVTQLMSCSSLHSHESLKISTFSTLTEVTMRIVAVIMRTCYDNCILCTDGSIDSSFKQNEFCILHFSCVHKTVIVILWQLALAMFGGKGTMPNCNCFLPRFPYKIGINEMQHANLQK